MILTMKFMKWLPGTGIISMYAGDTGQSSTVTPRGVLCTGQLTPKENTQIHTFIHCRSLKNKRSIEKFAPHIHSRP